jgi:hypothetical protein
MSVCLSAAADEEAMVLRARVEGVRGGGGLHKQDDRDREKDSQTDLVLVKELHGTVKHSRRSGEDALLRIAALLACRPSFGFRVL